MLLKWNTFFLDWRIKVIYDSKEFPGKLPFLVSSAYSISIKTDGTFLLGKKKRIITTQLFEEVDKNNRELIQQCYNH